MNYLSFILLDAAPKATGQSPIAMWVMLGLLFVVFYFFMIRPQSKRNKELRQFRESLKVGSKVVTDGGIHGKVNQIKEHTILLEIADKVVIKVNKMNILEDMSEAATTSSMPQKKK